MAITPAFDVSTDILSTVALLQGDDLSQDMGDSGSAGDATWAGQSQAAPLAPSPAHGVGAPKRQTISGETSRGRSPEPDPTGTEDSPLSQVTTFHLPLHTFPLPAPRQRENIPTSSPSLHSWKECPAASSQHLGQEVLS